MKITVRRGSTILFQGDLDAWLASRTSRASGLTFLSVCSGIEAASVAWNPLGWRAIGFAEIEKFPSAVLAHHYPDVPNYGDFTRIDTARIGPIDILCGGTPCQAFSVAGARGSLSDSRGNLTLAFVGLAHAIQPRNVVWENVPGVLSTRDNAFGCFLAGLVGADGALACPGKRWPNAGMVHGPKGRAAWRVLDAQYFGLAQRRKRVILVADFGNGADPAAVLFEPESVRRDSPPSRETGQGVADAVASSAGAGSERNGVAYAIGSHAGAADGDQTNRSHANGGPVGSNISEELAYSLRAGRTQNVAYAPPIARCDATREGSSQDYESTTMVAVGVTGSISHALKAEGADASEDGTGRGVPVIAFSSKDYGADASVKAPPTLRAGGHTSSHANAGVMPAVVQSIALRGRDGGATAEVGDDCAFALRASGGGGDKPHVLTEAVAFTASSQANSYAWERDIYPTLNAQIPNDTSNIQYGVRLGSAVRRLTPRECERLQGFQFLCSPTYPGAWQDAAGRYWSPDYTAIPYGNVSKTKLDADFAKYLARGNPKRLTREEVAGLAADGPRYKALGNSWAVPLFAWLGKRIAAHMPPRTAA